MVKLITVTWSFDKNFPIENSFLYRTFTKHNTLENFVHVHYDRNEYTSLEQEFSERFGYQYEYILYKIYLTRKIIESIESDVIIFADANDVVCRGNIQTILPPDNYILFSAEANQWPSSRGDWGGLDYSYEARQKSEYLNAGVFVTTKQMYIQLLDTVITQIFPTNLKSFGGDQGIFTYHYLSNFTPSIQLDTEFSTVISTFSRSYESFIDKQLPMFVHDNGWGHGSPRFIQKFNLL